MDIFILLLTNAIPLLFLIGLGFFAGRKFSVDTMTLANVAIFVIAPIVVFGAMLRVEFDLSYFILPVILLIFCAGVSLGAYRLAQKRFPDSRANIIGMSAGAGNTGYFGVPIVLSAFGPDVLGIYLFMNLAFSLNEVTVGYYIGARNQSSIRESLRKVAGLPHIYAITAGLFLNYCGFKMPDVMFSYWEKFVGAWIILGMMIIGATLARITTFSLNWPLMRILFFYKFILWPFSAYALILLDTYVFHLFDETVYGLLMILSLVPMAGNLAAMAIKLDLKAGDAAIAVLISTLIAIFYMPLMLVLTGVVG